MASTTDPRITARGYMTTLTVACAAAENAPDLSEFQQGKAVVGAGMHSPRTTSISRGPWISITLAVSVRTVHMLVTYA